MRQACAGDWGNFLEQVSTGPSPSWHAKLQELPLTSETTELRLKVKHCHDPRGNHLSSRDRLLGRNSIRIGGLKPGLAHQLTIPLFGRRPMRKGGGGGSQQGRDPDADEDDEDDAYSQAHASTTGKSGGDRVVYDPEADAMHGMAGLPPRGKLSHTHTHTHTHRSRTPSAARLLALIHAMWLCLHMCACSNNLRGQRGL
ncbi:hypothetical protein DUNSADRAFT_8501 [Dunaliella salina]|uniref:Encoded protein n=1 Tax=Dunaliella salina TaxID=3046 RepID=A0ABQ7GJE5_DUNSA|nr:hypothetical protein DUNSADRAFT_8501 [Dunaliella salina]|eukprot:KAF5834731.1 hypothetical protein DUNSADRAFT_8501 [Dunaliella salina]